MKGYKWLTHQLRREGWYIIAEHLFNMLCIIHADLPVLSLASLQSLQCLGKNKVKIIKRCSAFYAKIGHDLLNDTDGSIVKSLQNSSQDPDVIMHEIFGKWLREDADHSWKKLIECLRRCDLDTVARDIEAGLGMRAHSIEGLMLLLCCVFYTIAVCVESTGNFFLISLLCYDVYRGHNETKSWW